jgi:hypothetical protein
MPLAILKKLSRPAGNDNGDAAARHAHRGVVAEPAPAKAGDETRVDQSSAQPMIRGIIGRQNRDHTALSKTRSPPVSPQGSAHRLVLHLRRDLSG